MTVAAALDAFHFLRPAWLWGLAGVPLLAWAWHRRMSARDPWQGRVDAHLLPHLLEAGSGKPLRRAWPAMLACIAAVLALLALAGPSWQRGAQPLWQARMPLVIAVDLSASTAAADLPPSRLARARAAIDATLQAWEAGDVGLLAYAGDAYVVSPLTGDPANVAVFLDALSPDIMPGDVDAPSRADRAIAMAARLLRQAGHAEGDIVLLEDAASGQAVAAAREAAAQGYRVSVLGLGTTAGAPWRDTRGDIQRAALDAEGLRAVAAAGDGRYVPLAGGARDVLAVLGPRQGAVGAARGTAQAWRDQGYWLLPPLLLLVLFAFRRGGALALCLACALLPWTPARAADGSRWWQRPDQAAHARLVEGAEAYRQGRYDQALRAWDGVPGADAAYNRGNALARQGRFPEALEAYDRALQLRPGMADALANREAVRKAMRQPPPQDGDGEAQRQERPQPDPAAGEQRAPDDGDGQPPARPPPRGDGPRKPGEAGEPGQRAGESEHAREQRLANEARLRRVPDDPGGLLRARFALEHRRREAEGR